MSADPYVLPGTDGVLRNKVRARTAEQLKEREAGYVARRLALIASRGPTGSYTFERLCATHRYLFQDVYAWAGQPRSGLTTFGKREYQGGPVHRFTTEDRIEAEGRRIFDALQRDNELKSLDRATFAEKAGALFAEINQLHPFREGNGRTQVQFITALAADAGHPVDFSAISRERMIEASIAGSKGDLSPLQRMFEEITDPVRSHHLNKAITALGSFNFDWNERYIATVTQGQAYAGVFVGNAGAQFMLGQGDRIIIGFTADLDRIPAQAERISFTATARGYDAARQEAIETGAILPEAQAPSRVQASAAASAPAKCPDAPLPPSAPAAAAPAPVGPLVPAKPYAPLTPEKLHAAVVADGEVGRLRKFVMAAAGDVFTQRAGALAEVDRRLVADPGSAAQIAKAVRERPDAFGQLPGKTGLLGDSPERAKAKRGIEQLAEDVLAYGKAYNESRHRIATADETQAHRSSLEIPAPSTALRAILTGERSLESMSEPERDALRPEAWRLRTAIERRFSPEERSALARGDTAPLRLAGATENLAGLAAVLTRASTITNQMAPKEAAEQAQKRGTALEQ